MRSQARAERAARRAAIARERSDWIEKAVDRSLADLAERSEIAREYDVPEFVIEEREKRERSEILDSVSKYNERFAETQLKSDRFRQFVRNHAKRTSRRRKNVGIGAGALVAGAVALWFLMRKQ